MRLIFALAFTAALCGAAAAKDINLPLNDDEQRALMQLLDIANKAGGLRVAKAAMHFADKITAAAGQPAPAPDAEK